jgi:hypothetical protein
MITDNTAAASCEVNAPAIDSMSKLPLLLGEGWGEGLRLCYPVFVLRP